MNATHPDRTLVFRGLFVPASHHEHPAATRDGYAVGNGLRVDVASEHTRADRPWPARRVGVSPGRNSPQLSRKASTGRLFICHRFVQKTPIRCLKRYIAREIYTLLATTEPQPAP